MSSRIQLRSSNQGGAAPIEKVVTSTESCSVHRLVESCRVWCCWSEDEWFQVLSLSLASIDSWGIADLRQAHLAILPQPRSQGGILLRIPGELMCHRQLARSLPRVERRCRFLLMAGRPRERSAAALSIVPIWPPVYYYLARSILFQGTNHSADLQKLLIQNGTWAPWGFWDTLGESQ